MGHFQPDQDGDGSSIDGRRHHSHLKGVQVVEYDFLQPVWGNIVHAGVLGREHFGESTSNVPEVRETSVSANQDPSCLEWPHFRLPPPGVHLHRLPVSKCPIGAFAPHCLQHYLR